MALVDLLINVVATLFICCGQQRKPAISKQAGDHAGFKTRTSESQVNETTKLLQDNTSCSTTTARHSLKDASNDNAPGSRTFALNPAAAPFIPRRQHSITSIRCHTTCTISGYSIRSSPSVPSSFRLPAYGLNTHEDTPYDDGVYHFGAIGFDDCVLAMTAQARARNDARASRMSTFGR